jgi:hypothetical protein
MRGDGIGMRRRGFLCTVAAGGEVSLTPLPDHADAEVAPATPSARNAPVAAAAVETRPARDAAMEEGHSGSDCMVDVGKTRDIEHIAALPGSTFRVLQ